MACCATSAVKAIIMFVLLLCSPFHFVVVIIHSIVDDTPLFSNKIKCFS